jgi:hypothetical protein
MRLTIDFTPELLAKLKRAYHDAVAEGRTAFRFEGHILIVQYAAFLIQRIETKLGKRKRRTNR